MGKTFMDITDQQERLSLLRDHADKIETGGYIKVLTEEEIYDRREMLAEGAIKLRELQDKKKQLMSEMKIELEPVQDKINQLLTELKTGQVDMDGEMFLVADHVNGYMEFYDDRGEFIKSRKLRPEEKQGRVFNLNSKMGTDNK